MGKRSCNCTSGALAEVRAGRSCSTSAAYPVSVFASRGVASRYRTWSYSYWPLWVRLDGAVFRSYTLP